MGAHLSQINVAQQPVDGDVANPGDLSSIGGLKIADVTHYQKTIMHLDDSVGPVLNVLNLKTPFGSTGICNTDRGNLQLDLWRQLDVSDSLKISIKR